MSIIIGGMWVTFVVLWESAGLPLPALFGAPADVLLLIVFAWAYVRSPEEAIGVAIIGGFAADLLSDHPLGITVLALLPATVIGSVRGARLLDTDWVSTMLLGAAATLVYDVILLGLLRLSGDVSGLADALVHEAPAAALLNALLAPLVYLVVIAGSRDVRAARRQIRTAG
ncbi:MAG TPA: rod shape-determining protein MreD [Dehalococcoidia bacterium]|nr:rod shape-determining protein MreD [Dehalococcoidia bacterium]